jgi:UDP:flavonoid glycosyltransferase YjiC (YdhE family)
VRALFTFMGGPGHLEPLLPVALAARDAGHTVAVAGRPAVLRTTEALGLEVFGTATDRERAPERTQLLPVDRDREARDVRNGFGLHLARAHAPSICELGEAWSPDVLVCDEVDFGSLIAAERLGVPYASVVTLAAGSLVRQADLQDVLDTVRAEHGLPPDPGLEMLERYLVLSPVPPSFRDPAYPPPRTLHAFRPGSMPAVAPTDPPAVYFTLGTEFVLESGDLLERVLSGLGELSVQVVATVGSELDPAALGSLPANVRVERYVPQAEILPHASAVVCHGGSGSVLGAFAHGLPLVLLPMGADQPQNAQRCAELGAGLVLDVVAATAEDVRRAVSEILGDPSYRDAAGLLRDEFAALPGPCGPARRAPGERAAADPRLGRRDDDRYVRSA